MAVKAQFGGLTGCLAEEQMRAPRDYGALLSAAAAAGNNGYQYNCAGMVSGAQSELTCNGGGAMLASRKRGREAEPEKYMSSSSAALLPIPVMAKAVVVQQSPEAVGAARRVFDSGMTSTSGRPAALVADALVWELCQQGAEIDALVRAECERLRSGLEQARNRQCQALVQAAAAGAACRLREKEVELEAARRRATYLEERVRQEAAESQAWCGLARSNETVAAGLRATLDTLLLRGGAPAPAEEGFGDSDPTSPTAAADDAQSCCFGAKDAPMDGKWACKACGESEASVLLLPCRHLCLCKACEPRLDACPVCLAAKNASIHVAAN
ncbi:BOI-related E3 ubiquitin-protein ligase 1-like [Phragmites australis]|uniref:BOI-related E3 ubiquitin-protein ligase 1-like n=1 Tax=Phragmites australis TaxID=29695 RepID=UPI002D7745D1|nr:BOI-related E3 ubiquitin-protein ligase 1-like [Phragmites australis]